MKSCLLEILAFIALIVLAGVSISINEQFGIGFLIFLQTAGMVYLAFRLLVIRDRWVRQRVHRKMRAALRRIEGTTEEDYLGSLTGHDPGLAIEVRKACGHFLKIEPDKLSADLQWLMGFHEPKNWRGFTQKIEEHLRQTGRRPRNHLSWSIMLERRLTSIRDILSAMETLPYEFRKE